MVQLCNLLKNAIRLKSVSMFLGLDMLDVDYGFAQMWVK